MKCLKCQLENPDTQKFCGQCGAKLERLCPECGFSNPYEYRFCGECGQRLGEVVAEEMDAPAAEGERKHVTVFLISLNLTTDARAQWLSQSLNRRIQERGLL